MFSNAKVGDKVWSVSYVRINKLDHTFTPILTEVEIEKLMEGQC